MNDLKAIAARYGLKAPKKKSDLIDMIRARLSNPANIESTAVSDKEADEAPITMDLERGPVEEDVVGPRAKELFCCVHYGLIGDGRGHGQIVLRRGQAFIASDSLVESFALRAMHFVQPSLQTVPETYADNVICDDCISVNRAAQVPAQSNEEHDSSAIQAVLDSTVQDVRMYETDPGATHDGHVSQAEAVTFSEEPIAEDSAEQDLGDAVGEGTVEIGDDAPTSSAEKESPLEMNGFDADLVLAADENCTTDGCSSLDNAEINMQTQEPSEFSAVDVSSEPCLPVQSASRQAEEAMPEDQTVSAIVSEFPEAAEMPERPLEPVASIARDEAVADSGSPEIESASAEEHRRQASPAPEGRPLSTTEFGQPEYQDEHESMAKADLPHEDADLAHEEAGSVVAPDAHLLELAFERNLTELAHGPLVASLGAEPEASETGEVEIESGPNEPLQADGHMTVLVAEGMEGTQAHDDNEAVEGRGDASADSQYSGSHEMADSQDEAAWTSQPSSQTQSSSQSSQPFPGDLDPHSFVLPNFFSPSHAGNDRATSLHVTKPEPRVPIKPSTERLREALRGKRFQGEGVAGYEAEDAATSLGVGGVRRKDTGKAARKRGAKTAPATPWRGLAEDDEEPTRALTPGPAMRKLPGGMRGAMTPQADAAGHKRARRDSRLNGEEVEIEVPAAGSGPDKHAKALDDTDVAAVSPTKPAEQNEPGAEEQALAPPVPQIAAASPKRRTAPPTPAPASPKPVRSSPRSKPATPRTDGKSFGEGKENAGDAPVVPKPAAKRAPGTPAAAATPGKLRHAFAAKIMSPLRSSIESGPVPRFEEDEDAETF
ncbi:hypothetical protein DFJ74DRAFT_677256 [Hyaloraphidium curvatum]|nr:hypothetical protein DFJ74DRAFT_677256 [Hyaloraphidium curvatum]